MFNIKKYFFEIEIEKIFNFFIKIKIIIFYIIKAFINYIIIYLY